jgi:hypothetical protein
VEKKEENVQQMAVIIAPMMKKYVMGAKRVLSV